MEQVNRFRIIDERLGLKVDELGQQEEQLLYIVCMILHNWERVRFGKRGKEKIYCKI